jgi:hypothetical protein
MSEQRYGEMHTTTAIVIRGGEEVTSSFAEVRLGNLKYLFLLVDKALTEDDRDELLDGRLRRFGRVLGRDAKIVHTYPGLDPFREVIAKNWDHPELVDRMRATGQPFLLVIATDFASFDPRRDSWEIVWLEGYDKAKLRDVFDRLAEAVQLEEQTGEDIFHYIERRLADDITAERDTDRVIEKSSGRIALALPAATLVGVRS